MNLTSYQARFAAIADKANLKLSGDYQNDILALTKVYKSSGSAQAAKSVILNEPVAEADVEAMLGYLENSERIGEDVTALDNNFLERLSQLNVADLDGMDEVDLQQLRTFKDSYKGLLSENLNGNAARADALFKAIDSFGDIAAKKNEDAYSHEGIAAGVVSRMFQPVTAGKTVGQAAEMYPANSDGETIVDAMYTDLYNFDGEGRFLGSKSGLNLSEEEAKIFVSAYNNHVKAVEQNFANTLKEQNMPVPVIVNDTDIPDYGAAVKRIADEATDFLKTDLLGGNLDDKSEKMAQAYRDAVETQVKRLLIESGYENKCNGVFYSQDLKDDIADFIKEDQFPTYQLPLFFTEEMVKTAQQIALSEVMAGDPRLQSFTDRANAGSKFTTNDRTEFLMTKESMRSELDRGLPEYNENNRVIGCYSLEKMDQEYLDYWRNAINLVKLDPKDSNGVDFMSEVCFDGFIKANPQFNATFDNPTVWLRLGTYTDENGKDKVDVTKLFYIDGNEVDDYIHSKLGESEWSMYSDFPEYKKINYRKAAIMQAAHSEENHVDAKTYVQKPDMSVEVFVSTIVDDSNYPGGFTKAKKDEIYKNSLARTAKIIVNDKIAAEINNAVEGRKNLLHTFYVNLKNNIRGSERTSRKTSHERYLNAHPEEAVREQQEELKGSIIPAVPAAITGALKLSPPESVEPVTVVSGIANAQQEDLIKKIDFKKLSGDSLFSAVKQFDELILKSPWLTDSINNPDVAAAYKIESKSADDRGDVTKLFYIDGKTIDEYLQSRIPDYAKYTPAEREFLGKTAVMNALAAGGHTVDAKGYVQKGSGACEVKVSNIVYGPAYTNDPAERAADNMQALLRAERIIAQDTVVNTLNAELAATVQEELENVHKAENNITAVNSRITEMFVPHISANSGTYRVMPDLQTTLNLAKSGPIDFDSNIEAPVDDPNTALMESEFRNVNFSKLDAAKIQYADRLFNDIVLKNEPWLTDSINHPVVAEACKMNTQGQGTIGDVTKLFYIDNRPAHEYLKDIIVRIEGIDKYNQYSDSEKQALCKVAIMNALASSNNHFVDAKGYVPVDGKQCQTVVKHIRYDRASFANVRRLEERLGYDATRAAAIIAADTVKDRIDEYNDNILKSQVADLAKMYKIYTNSQNGTPATAEQLLFKDVIINHQDVNNTVSFFNNGVNADGVANANVAAFRNYAVNTLYDLKLDNAAGLENMGDVRNNAATINRLANTVSSLALINKQCAVPANTKQQSAIQNLSTLSDIFKDLNSEDPVKAMAATMAYNMFAANLRGKTLGQLADMYPVNDKGNTYFSVAADELGKFVSKNFADITAADVQAYRATGILPDAQKNSEFAEKCQNVINSINDGYYGRLATEGDLYYNSMLSPENRHTFTDVSVRGTAPNGEERTQPRFNNDNSLFISEENLPVPIVVKSPDMPDYQKAINRIVSNAAASLGADQAVTADFSRVATNVLTAELLNSGYIADCQNVKYRQDIINDINGFINGGRALPYFFTPDMVAKSLHIATQRINATHNTNLPDPNLFIYDLKAIKPELVTNDQSAKFVSVNAAEKEVELRNFEDINVDLENLDPKYIDLLVDNRGDYIDWGKAFCQIFHVDPSDLRNMDDETRNFYAANLRATNIDITKAIISFSKYSKEKVKDIVDCYKELSNSYDCPEVQADCKDFKSNMFYINGLRMDDYIKKEIGASFWDNITAQNGKDNRHALKEAYASAVLLDAIYVKHLNVDAKCYCRNTDGTCEVKVLPVVTNDTPELSDETAAKRRENAQKIIKNDKVAEKINKREAKIFEPQHKDYILKAEQFRKAERANSGRDAVISEYNKQQAAAARTAAMQAQAEKAAKEIASAERDREAREQVAQASAAARTKLRQKLSELEAAQRLAEEQAARQEQAANQQPAAQAQQVPNQQPAVPAQNGQKIHVELGGSSSSGVSPAPKPANQSRNSQLQNSQNPNPDSPATDTPKTSNIKK